MITEIHKSKNKTKYGKPNFKKKPLVTIKVRLKGFSQKITEKKMRNRKTRV